jgi:hypothetical protein
LKIIQIDTSHDAGSYTCIVRSRSGEEARRDIQINVNSPPVIEPFVFPKNVQENGRAQISCSVSSGDMPVYFQWYKDGSPLPLSLQVRIFLIVILEICILLRKLSYFFSFSCISFSTRSVRKKKNSFHFSFLRILQRDTVGNIHAMRQILQLK